MTTEYLFHHNLRLKHDTEIGFKSIMSYLQVSITSFSIKIKNSVVTYYYFLGGGLVCRDEQVEIRNSYIQMIMNVGCTITQIA